METCFIIMPITTPSKYVDRYKGDADHFIHVLEELFVPAIEYSDLEPIKPIVKGSEMIHAKIIKNLVDADLVLCDMTLFNPNVFFELGIRTAINKPVTMVKDNYTDKTPFDLAPVNYHQYDSSLSSWVIDNEIENLSDHIDDCMEEDTDNAIWKYLGVDRRVEKQDRQVARMENNSPKFKFSVRRHNPTYDWASLKGKPVDWPRPNTNLRGFLNSEAVKKLIKKDD